MNPNVRALHLRQLLFIRMTCGVENRCECMPTVNKTVASLVGHANATSALAPLCVVTLSRFCEEVQSGVHYSHHLWIICERLADRFGYWARDYARGSGVGNSRVHLHPVL